MKLNLPAQPPFSLQAVVGSHGWIKLAPFKKDEQSGGLTYVDQLASGRVVELHIQETSSGVQVRVDVALEGDEVEEVTNKVTWMLGLEQDLSGFYALAQDEPKLARTVERAEGRILRSPTLFEDTVKTILTTNTAWGGTIRMVQALVSTFGAPLESDPELRAFPKVEKIAASNEETLRSSVRLGYRAPYVLALARALDSGELDLEALKHSQLPTPDLRKRLLAIKGVGGYAAANLLMLLGRYDYLPVDSWALKVVSHEWYDGQPIGEAEVETSFERWGEWKGLAYWFWDWTIFNQE